MVMGFWIVKLFLIAYMHILYKNPDGHKISIKSTVPQMSRLTHVSINKRVILRIFSYALQS